MQVDDVPHTGLDAAMGLRIDSISDDRVTGNLPVAPHVVDAGGMVHRGVLSSVIESVASVAAAAHLGDAGHVVGVANSTSYFATVSSGSLTVIAEPISRLTDRQEWVVQVRDDTGQLLAQGTVQLANVRDAGQLGN